MSSWTPFLHPLHSTSSAPLQRLHRTRGFILAAVALAALLSATVAIAQASQNFDLACRSIMSGGGGTRTSASFGVTAALGAPIALPANPDTFPTYSVRSANFGLRGGFLPGYPTDLGVTTAAHTTTPAEVEQSLVQWLPRIFKTIFIIRGGC